MNRHFISLNLPGVTREQGRERMIRIIYQALQQVVYYAKDELPPPLSPERRLRVATLFEEASTRTRLSSETAAFRLRLDVMNGITRGDSSLLKGETLEDTVTMLRQNDAWAVVVRTKTEGAGLWLAEEIQRIESADSWIRPGLSVIIGGEGTLHHWTQVALDATTWVLAKLGVTSMDHYPILEELLAQPDAKCRLHDRIAEILDHLTLAFVGDMKYSRVVHSHVQLGRFFGIKFLFVGPKEFQPPRWWTKGLESYRTDNLNDARQGWDFIYFMRTQMERLVGTPENPGSMSAREARALIAPLNATREFADNCQGWLMHAQPRDSADGMFPDELKVHPKALVMMASAVGVPTREAIYIDCHRARDERGPVFTLPEMEFQESWLTKPPEWWDEHHEELLARYAGQNQEGIVQSIMNGTAADRFEWQLVPVHDRIFSLDGVYRQPSGRQILPGRKLNSPTMVRPKGTIWLFGYDVLPKQAAKHGIVSACSRFSYMRKAGEDLSDPSTKGYWRVEYPLPLFLEGTFTCLNPNCITHRSKVKPVFRVEGQKGEVGEGFWPEVGLECIYCGQLMSAQEAVEHDFGNLILKEDE